MQRYRTLGALLLVVATALLLAACGGAGGSGGSGGGQQGGGDSGGSQQQEQKQGDGMSGMDHGSMAMGSGGARGMVMENGEYSDKAFIDAMVPHHQGAVEMAQVALKNAKHREIKNLAEDIVGAQEAEIEELKAIKREEYGTSEVPMEMSPEEMRGMGMTMDPQKLAKAEPFDKAFIDAMMPHHRSAIDMARVALEQSDNPEIKGIARAIVKAQRQEISQMEEWRREWYPRS